MIDSVRDIDDFNKSIDIINKNSFVSSVKSVDGVSFKSYCVTNMRTGRKQTYEFDVDSCKFNLIKDEYAGTYFSD
jgi:hypothetical protein